MLGRLALRPTGIALLALLAACAERAASERTTNPTTPTSARASAEPAPAASTSATPPHPRKPFDIYNACDEVVNVVFGADGRSEESKRTLAPYSSMEGPRDDEGNQTVWLLDEKRQPLVKVNVTRGMKRVEVGRSCRTLDAR